MKRKIIECDICGKEIEEGKEIIVAKRWFHDYGGGHWWKGKMDICPDCQKKMIEFINKERGE